MPATSVLLGEVYGVAVDRSGDIYFTEPFSRTIRRVSAATGTITTIAGTGVPGYSGPGPARTAALNWPHGLAFDSRGDLYVADHGDNAIRRISLASGLISTVAGGGWGFSGDGGPATAATMAVPSAIAFDGSDNLYIVDSWNQRVRRVSANGTITTVAGNGEAGYSGDGGPATQASFSLAEASGGIAVDAAGNLFLVDGGNQRIRRIASGSGVVTTVAGNGTAGYSGDGGPATAASVFFSGGAINGIAVDARGDLLFADRQNSRVRRVSAATGVVTTIAGDGTYGFSGDGGPATSASLNGPTSIALGPSGDAFVGEHFNQVIRRVTAAAGIISTVAGTGPRGSVGDDGPATATSLGYPAALVVDGAGNLVIADLSDRRVRRISARTGLLSTAAGGGAMYPEDGALGTDVYLMGPASVAVDPAGNLFVGDKSHFHAVFKVSGASSVLSAFVGRPGVNGDPADGIPATTAAVAEANGLATDAQGNVYVADPPRLRKVTASSGIISTVAGGGTSYPGDNGPATRAALGFVYGVAVDPAGNLFVSDPTEARVRRVDGSTGVITTYAGTGTAGFSGDGGKARSAQLRSPRGLALDAAGNLFIADTGNSRVRKVTPAGTITTVAGTGSTDFSGDDLPASLASVASPTGVAVDAAGTLFISSPDEARVRGVFACRAPDRPQLASPADGGSAPFQKADLSFTPAVGGFAYDVYLDTEIPPRRLVASGLPPGTTTPFWIPDGTVVTTSVSNLLAGRTYYWQVVARGDPNCAGLPPSASPVFSFTTTKPCTEPAGFGPLAPGSGSTVTGSGAILSWSAAEGAAFYDLYLGTTSPPRLFRQGLKDATLAVSGLLPSSVYSWFLLAYAACDPTKVTGSAISTFVTSGPCNPIGAFSLSYPSAAAQGVSTNLTLAWTASAGAGSYDVYLGRSADPPLYQAGVGGPSLDVGGLALSATYYWKVVARSPCDPARNIASPVASFTTSGSCNAPARPSFTFVPPGKVAAGQTYVLVWAPVPLDPGGAYLVERSRSASFSPVLDSFVTIGTSAAFVPDTSGVYHHRVLAVAGCDPGRRSPASATATVEAIDGKPVVIFTKPPRGLVAPVGTSLESSLDVVDPDRRSRNFTIQNLSTNPVTVIVALNALSPSPSFFRVDDTGGASTATGIPLAPGETRTLTVAYSGVPSATPASYQGVLYLFASGQEIVPYAFVNLKLGGEPAAAPELRISGTAVEYAAFPGLPASVDDAGRPPLSVDVHNPGPGTMELAAEIGPEVWLEPVPGWNDSPIPAGASRTVQLRTRRNRALAASAFPRYTYFTVRTRDGATARLMVQDSDVPVTAQDPRAALPADTPSFIVPSVVNATSRIGSTFLSRLRLSNAGSEDVQVELVYTPAGADGFDAGAVRRLKLTVPRNDVVSLTDPLVQLFGLTPPAVGQLEVRADPARLGALTVTSGVDAPARSGGAFGFQLPILRRGDGASLGRPQLVPAITVDAGYRSNVILAETTGRDGASVTVTLYDGNGARLGEKSTEVRRYGQTQFALADLLGSAPSLPAGLVEFAVTSGGGTVAAVVTVIDNVNDDSSTYVSRPAVAPAAPSALVAQFGKPGKEALAPATARFGVPAVVNGYATFPGTDLPYSFRSQLVLASATQQGAGFTLTYTDLTAGGGKTTRTVSVPGRGTRIFDNVLEELFEVPAGQRSQGPMTVEADLNGLVTVRVYSRLASGTLGDSFPVVSLPPQSTEQLTGTAASRPLSFDGLEQSIDVTRGTRSNLILNEWLGQTAIVTVRLYEAGNRSRPIVEQDVALAPFEKVQLSTVFSGLGLDTDERRKDRTNVLCVVTPKAGNGLVSAVVTTIDNRTGDTRNAILSPTAATAGSGGVGIGR